jgi:hypothetical protein
MGIDAEEITAFLREAVLPLAVLHIDEKRCEPIGTAFVIGVPPSGKAAFLLTAKHVLDPVLVKERAVAPHHASTPPMFRPPPPRWIDMRRTGLRLFPPGPEGTVTPTVLRCWHTSALDVALLMAAVPDDSPFVFTRALGLDARPVEQGTPVAVWGYPRMNVTALGHAGDQVQAELEYDLEAREGMVRESVLHVVDGFARPGFLVDVPFDSGMSGGPILDRTMWPPRARGVIGRDISLTEDQSLGSGLRAWASELWPVMMTPTELVIDSGDGTLLAENATLADLARLGMIDDSARSHEHLHEEETADGQRLLHWIP